MDEVPIIMREFLAIHSVDNVERKQQCPEPSANSVKLFGTADSLSEVTLSSLEFFVRVQYQLRLQLG